MELHANNNEIKHQKQKTVKKINSYDYLDIYYQSFLCGRVNKSIQNTQIKILIS